MGKRFEIDAVDDDEDLFFADDPDSPTTSWSIDELDRSADLGSVRSACSDGDDF